MVAMVSGNGLGLLDSSLVNVGLAGMLGQAGNGGTVNIATGNLVLQMTDESMSGTGADLRHTRTYNAQGTTNDGDGDQWRWNGERKLVVSGTINTAGSTITRTTGDGHEAVYTWNGSKYTSNTGSGAHDEIVLSGSELVWTEGSSQVVERYDSTSGWIKSVRDTNGNGFDFTFTSGQLTKVKDVGSGQTLELVYGTSGNGNGKLIRLDTRTTATGSLTSQVHYEYDSSGRLDKVKTDLTPSDSSITDGAVYETSYTYDGSSFRVASVTQGDGSTASFGYQNFSGTYRVTSVTDQSGTTTFSYDTTAKKTTVTNGAGDVWTYYYDSNDQLTKVESELIGGVRQSVAFTYENGDVKTITDGLGEVLTYTYDSNGNRTEEQDATDHRITRTFSSTNQVLTETRYETGTSSDPETVRYAYDSNNNLRYIISAEGRVTEHKYNSDGQVTDTIRYAGDQYNVSGLSTTTALTESQLNTWVSSADKSDVELTEHTYDYRGNLDKTTAFATVNSSGVGQLDDAATVTKYVFSEHGQLLQTINVTGSARTTETTVSSVAYDGAGRVTSVINMNGTTTTSYDASNRKVTVSNSGTGLSTVSTYNSSGQLTNVTSSGDSQNRVMLYRYDSAGRLIEAEASDGGIAYTYYDAAGRVAFSVAPEGKTVGYAYNANGQVTTETHYWNAFNHGTETVTTHSYDRATTYAYDDAGRLLSSTQEFGAADVVEELAYDNTGRVAETTLGGDRVTRHFYDDDGLLQGTLNAEGYLSEFIYDGVGRLTQVVRYETEVTGATFTSGDFAAVKAAADDDDELYTHYWYDSQGRQVGVVSELGFLTETEYDPANKQVLHHTYMTAVTVTAGEALSAVRGRADDDGTLTTEQTYDDYGRLIQTERHDGSSMYYTYDSEGRLVRTINEVTLEYGEARSNSLTYMQYNAFGEMTGIVSGEGASSLSAGTLSSDTAVQSAIDDYGVKADFDALGRKIAEYGADGQKTLYYYDTAGRLSYSVRLSDSANALGDVVRVRYQNDGSLKDTRAYSTRVSTTGLTGGSDASTLESRLTEVSDDEFVQHLSYVGSTEKMHRLKDGLLYPTYTHFDKYGEAYRKVDYINTEWWQSGVTIYSDTRFKYDKLGRLYRLDQYDGTAWHYTETFYDGFNRVTQTQDAEGNDRFIDYQNNGRTVLTTDPLGRTAKVSYDALGRVISTRDGYDQETTYAFNDSTNSVTVTSPENVTMTTWSNEMGQVLKVQDGEDNVTEYIYDLDGNLVEVIDANLNSRTTDYDDSGRVYETTDANGNVVRFTYDAANRVTERAVDPTGLNLRTHYTYDGQGRTLTVTEGYGTSDAQKTEYKYDGAGNVKQIITDPGGLDISTSFEYDGLGNVTVKEEGTVSSPAERRTEYSYDKKGRLTTEVVDMGTDPDLTTEYRYNKNDQLTRLIDAEGNSTWFVYNDAGQKSHEINAEGAVTRYDYDQNGKLYHTWAYANTVSTVGFGDVVTSVTVTENSANDRRSFNVYGDDGQLTYVLTAVGEGKWRVTESVYDDNFNVVELHQHAKQLSDAQVTTLDGNTGDATTMTVAAVTTAMASGTGNAADTRVTKYEYDNLNRQVKTILPGWYDTTDQHVYATSESQSDRFQRTIEVTYDAAGNAVKNEIKTGVSTSVIEYKSYDAANRLVHSIDGNGHVTEHGYDDAGNVETITRYENTVGTPPARGYWIGSENPVTGNSRVLTNTYDAAGRKTATKQSSSSYYATSSTTATSNNASASSYSGSPETKYEYNAMGEVVKQRVKVDNSTWADTYFYYDKAGRQTLVVDAEKHGTKMDYDGVGNVTKVTEYIDPTTGTPTTTTAPSFTATNEDRITRYEYNNVGQVEYTYRDNTTYTTSQNSAASTNQDNLLVANVVYNAFGEVKDSYDVLNNHTQYAYNRAGQLKELTEPQRNVSSLEESSTKNYFDDTTNASPVTTITYNAFGEVLSEARDPDVTGMATVTTSFAYDHVGNVITVTDAESNVHTAEYDVAGRVIAEETAITGGEDVRREYVYDNVGRQTESLSVITLDSNTHKSGQRTVYNAYGDITEERLVYGVNGGSSQLLASYWYNNDGTVYKKEDNQGTTFYYHNLAGQLTRQEARGNESTADGTDTRVTEWGRDLLGRAVIERQPEFSGLTNAITSQTNVTLTPYIKQTYDRWGNVTEMRIAGGTGASTNDEVVSNYSYDHDNRLIQEEMAETDRMKEDGTVDQVRLERNYHYNKAGHMLRQSDGLNGAETHVRKAYYNEVGQMTKQTDATGVNTEYRYDAHGNQVATKDGVGNIRMNDYDKLNRLTDQALYRTGVQEVTGSTVVTHTTYVGYPIYQTFTWTTTVESFGTVDRLRLAHYDYDEAGRRTGDTVYKDDNNRSGGTIGYEYDGRGNVIKMTDRLGNDTDYEYNSQGQKTSESYDVNTSLTNTTTWTYKTGNYEGGQFNTRTEAGGRVTTYTYNDFGQVSKEAYTNDGNSGLTDNERNYSYHDNGLLKEVEDLKNWSYGAYFSDDERFTKYDYDIRGNVVREQVIDDQSWSYTTVYENHGYGSSTFSTTYTTSGSKVSTVETRSLYDEHNRLIEVASPEVGSNNGLWADRAELTSLTYDYDEYGNRRKISSEYILPDSSTTRTLTAWYRYDAEGRTLVEQGEYNSTSGEIERIKQDEDSIAYSYDAAGRLATTEVYHDIVMTYTYTRTTYTTETSSWPIGYEVSKLRHEYDDLGREDLVAQQLIEYDLSDNLVSTGTEKTIETQTYDTRGFMAQHTTNNGATVLTRTDNVYNDNGGLTSTSSYNGSNQLTGKTTYTYDLAGNTTRYEYSHYTNGSYQFKYTYDNAYRYVSNANFQQSKTMVTRSNSGWKPGNSFYNYDNRGNLAKISITGGQTGTKSFIHDNDGRILARKEAINGSTTRYTSYFYENGRSIGSIGTGSNGVNLLPSVQHEAGPTPGTYSVVGGETLGDIAQAVYGDASLWYLIANENGLNLGPGTQLTGSYIGTQLTIPNVDTALQNTTDNFKPYNPGEIIGDNSPSPVPPPPPTKSCNPIATIIMVVVAVIVTIYTAGAASGAAAQFGGSTWQAGLAATTGGLGASGAVAAGVGGFAGSLASQAVGKALGVVDEISIKSAFASGLTAGISAGTMSYLSGLKETDKIFGILKNTRSAQIATQSVVSYVGNYAANKLVGLETSFSWRGMAAQVAGGFMGAAAGSVLSSAPDIVKGTISGFVAGGTTAALRGDADVNYAQIALDAFGNSVANSMVSALVDHDHHEFQIDQLAKRFNADPANAQDREVLERALIILRSDRSSLEVRRETVRDLIQLAGVDDKQSAEIMSVYDSTVFARESEPGTISSEEDLLNQPPYLGDGPIQIVVYGTMDAAFGWRAADDMLIGAGEFASYVSENIEERPWLKYGLLAIDVATGPAAFAVREALMASPVGDLVETGSAKVMEEAQGRFEETGYSASESMHGGGGAFAVLLVAAMGALATVKALKNAGFKGKYANRANVNHRSADDVNAELGYDHPPYMSGTRVTEYTNIEAERFVRVHVEGNAARSWMIKKEAIEGLTPEQLQFKYSLPTVPTMISDIHVPAGTTIRTGRVAPNFGGGQGATQYQWVGRVPQEAVTNTRPLGGGG